MTPQQRRSHDRTGLTPTFPGTLFEPNNILLRAHGKSPSPEAHITTRTYRHIIGQYGGDNRHSSFLRKSRRTLLPAAFNSPTLELLEDSPRRRVREVSFDSIHTNQYASEYQHVASYISASFILPAETISAHVIQGTLDIERQEHTYPASHVVFHDKQISEIEWPRNLCFMLILLMGSLAHSLLFTDINVSLLRF